MAKGFKAGVGGGAPLNFRVVGNPQPASPKENTIWVNTDVPIGKWYFDANQPDDLQEGDAWFSVGMSSHVEFNALKKNGIQLYPQGARQMIGGELVSKDAKIYQGGAWVELICYLFNNGDQNVSITGGWKQSTGIYIANSGVGSVSIGDTLYCNAPDNVSAVVCPKNMVDLTHFTTLNIEIEAMTSSAYFGVSTATSGNLLGGVAAAGSLVNGAGLHSLDISSLTGKYYVYLGCNNGRNVTISKCWLV